MIIILNLNSTDLKCLDHIRMKAHVGINTHVHTTHQTNNLTIKDQNHYTLKGMSQNVVLSSLLVWLTLIFRLMILLHIFFNMWLCKFYRKRFNLLILRTFIIRLSQNHLASSSSYLLQFSWASFSLSLTLYSC